MCEIFNLIGMLCVFVLVFLWPQAFANPFGFLFQKSFYPQWQRNPDYHWLQRFFGQHDRNVQRFFREPSYIRYNIQPTTFRPYPPFNPAQGYAYPLPQIPFSPQQPNIQQPINPGPGYFYPPVVGPPVLPLPPAPVPAPVYGAPIPAPVYGPPCPDSRWA